MALLLRSPCLVAFLALLAQGAATAQGAPPLSPGMRVRVTVATLPSANGTVVESSKRSFRFAREKSADTITVEYANVVQLDLSQGMHNRTAHDAIWGAGMGAALGAVAGAFSDAGTDPRYTWYADSIPEYCSVMDPGCRSRRRTPHHPPFVKRTLTGLGIGALGGAAVGALYGHLRKTESWKRVPSEQYRVHVAIAPSLGGVGFRLRIAM